MKQGFITFLCLFISLNVLIAQTKIHSKTTYYNGINQRNTDELYTYLPQQTIITTWGYYSNGQAGIPTNKILGYNNLGQKVTETMILDYYGFGQKTTIQSQTLYKYDNKGCLIEQTFTETEVGKTPYSVEQHVFKRSIKCLVEEEIITRTYPISPASRGWTVIKTFQYDKNDSLLTLSYRVKDSLADYGYLKFERSPDGKPLTLINSNASDNSIASSLVLTKYVYAYDSLGRCDNVAVYTQERTPNSPYILKITIKNDYDTEGSLVRQTSFAASSGLCTTTETSYVYTCGKFLKEVIVKLLTGNSICGNKFLIRHVYTYTDAQPCPPVESGDFTLFPNPTCNFFSIQSPSLKSGNWQMTLVDALGKVQMQQKLNAASEIFDFWLTNLPSGLYYVALTNGQEKMVKKLFIAN